MAPTSGTKKARYGTRALIEQVFQDPGNGTGLKTSELVLKVQSASGAGSKIPAPTIFQAARALVKKKILEAKRDGREFRFRLAAHEGSNGARGQLEPRAASEPSGSLASALIAPSPAEPEAVQGHLPVTSLPHRLDPGQMLVLKHDQNEIVTLTNVHGKPVIERHPV